MAAYDATAHTRRKRRRSCCIYSNCHHYHECVEPINKHCNLKMALMMSMMICGVGHSMALMSVMPSRGHHSICKSVHYHSLLNRHSRTALYSANDVDFDSDDYSSADSKGDGEEDDNGSGADEYYDRFISEALIEEEEMNKNTKPPEVSSSTSDNTDDNSMSETKRMMEQQQQQIDLLMKLVQQQGRQQLPPPTPGTQTMNTDSNRQQQSTPMQQNSINVAPLKAMLFIDGTWLYYSLNSRNPKRDPIIPKFGMGWQNNYKVDW